MSASYRVAGPPETRARRLLLRIRPYGGGVPTLHTHFGADL